MKEVYDCVVVGAGPAGAFCAYKLAKSGKSVLLLEQKKMPRNKPCTGMVPGECVNILEREIGGFPKNLCVWPFEYKGIKYKVAKGVPVITSKTEDDEIVYSVKRSEFDYWLTLEASKAGADVEMQCAFVSIIEKCSDKVIIKVLKKYQDDAFEYMTVEARYLVAADGMASNIRRTLFPERNQYLTSFAKQDYYVGQCNLEPEYYHFFVYNTAIAEPVWFFHKDNQIVIGYSVGPTDSLQDKKKKILQYFIEEHGMKIKEECHTEVCAESINYTALKIKDDKLNYIYGCEDYPILFVGEAAEMVDSMSEGIHVAIESAGYAADAIVQNMHEPNKNLVETYKFLCDEMIIRIVANWQLFWKKFGRVFVTK